jgi:hypothetical protein
VSIAKVAVEAMWLAADQNFGQGPWPDTDPASRLVVHVADATFTNVAAAELPALPLPAMRAATWTAICALATTIDTPPAVAVLIAAYRGPDDERVVAVTAVAGLDDVDSVVVERPPGGKIVAVGRGIVDSNFVAFITDALTSPPLDPDLAADWFARTPWGRIDPPTHPSERPQ